MVLTSLKEIDACDVQRTRMWICGGCSGIPLETATAKETSLTPLENAAVREQRPMQTLTASATTSTHVLESLTIVACATDQEPSTVCAHILKAAATVMATSLTPLENAMWWPMQR